MRGIRPEEYLLALGRDETELTGAERRRWERFKSLDREALSGAGAVVCVSEPYRRHLGGGDKVFVISNGSVPPPVPDAAERERERVP